MIPNSLVASIGLEALTSAAWAAVQRAFANVPIWAMWAVTGYLQWSLRHA